MLKALYLWPRRQAAEAELETAKAAKASRRVEKAEALLDDLAVRCLDSDSPIGQVDAQDAPVISERHFDPLVKASQSGGWSFNAPRFHYRSCGSVCLPAWVFSHKSR